MARTVLGSDSASQQHVRSGVLWRPSATRLAATWVTMTCLFMAGGCGAPSRPTLTEAQLQERSVADAKETGQTFRDAIGRVLARMEKKAQTQTDGPPVLNFLAMSGGGDFGAFGAGFLVGWGTAQDPAWRRPDFDAVTGVSTGALLAPFAYLGTDEACLEVEKFYRNPKKDWIQDRSLLFFLPYNPSFMEIPGLDRDIRRAVDKQFIERMAEQSRLGKVMAVSATDLDLGRQKFWDVGAEAEAAVKSGNYDKVHKILLASAAIPAIFPSVTIDGSLYADGGVSANVFLRLDPRSPDAILPRWRKAHPDKPFPKVRYWIIINNQINQPPKTVQEKWPHVMGPSLATAIRSATLAEVRWLAAQADFVNAVWNTDIEVRSVAIPDNWRAPVSGDFKKETMESLTDLGRRMGADPKSWHLWASPADLEALRANGVAPAGKGQAGSKP